MHPLLVLEVVAEPAPGPYHANETVQFTLKLTNTSGHDLSPWTLFEKQYNQEGEAEYLDWEGTLSGGLLKNGESETITRSYTLTETEADIGAAWFQWYAIGQTDEATPVYSNQTERQISLEGGPSLLLTPTGNPVGDYHYGDPIVMNLLLCNNGPVPLKLYQITTYKIGDIVSTETWMSEPLVPGQTYPFTVTTTWNGSPWGFEHRYIIATALDETTGKGAGDTAEVFITQKASGPSLDIIVHDLTGMGGVPDETVWAPVTVVNNGTTDLMLTEASGTWPFEHTEIPEYYQTNPLPMGESFEMDYGVEVQHSDLPAGSIDRSLTVRGTDPATGTEVEDTESFSLWLKEESALTLAMTQTSEKQTVYSPIDSSGNLGQISYKGLIRNDGDVKVAVSDLYAYIYPDITTPKVVINFGGDIALEPGENHEFSFNLSYSLDNVFPESGGPGYDGRFDAAFLVVGKDPDTAL